MCEMPGCALQSAFMCTRKREEETFILHSEIYSTALPYAQLPGGNLQTDMHMMALEDPVKDPDPMKKTEP